MRTIVIAITFIAAGVMMGLRDTHKVISTIAGIVVCIGVIVMAVHGPPKQ